MDPVNISPVKLETVKTQKKHVIKLKELVEEPKLKILNLIQAKVVLP